MTEPNFANRTVWTGDNLDILRGLNSETVDLIYLDPPFNSNQDYAAPVGSKAAGAAFKDTWHLSDLDVAWMGLIAEEQPAVAALLATTGDVHGKGMQSYLTMMAVRLIEMHRVLKDTGSIYLHCDPTASHYLKLMLDAVFGGAQFRNEIVWQRTNAKGLATKNLPNNHDLLIRYTKSPQYVWNPQFVPHDPEYVTKFYRYVEPGTGRRYRLGDLTNPNKDRPNLTYEFLGVTRVWRWTRERMQAAYEAGRVVQSSPGGVPAFKRYLDEQPGRAIDSLWTDIAPLSPNDIEKTGYPTQKPVALLERIIAASSNPGDVVLDPFCGCATACVAAEKLDRQWLGIDLSSKAVELVNERLRAEMGALFHHGYVTARTDIPQRTDVDAPKNYRQNKHVLFGQQEGRCGGCAMDFPYKLFEVDHVVPQSRGGTDHIDNLQLLCSHCNRVKGDREQAYLVARLAEFAGAR